MADKVYPSAKPTLPVTNTGANANFPANKAQMYNAARAAYRPQPPPRRRSGRSFCCSCCLCSTLLLLLVLLIAAVAGALFYFVYKPHRPTFSVASLHLAKFNLTSTAVISDFSVTLTARNPNKRIGFAYDPIALRIFSGDLSVGEGSIAGFTQAKRNVTNLRAVVTNSSPFKDGSDVSKLRSSLRSRNLPIRIQFDTEVTAKIGKIETKKLKIRVSCDGIRIAVPAGKTATVGSTANVKCEVDPRVKIFKWTV